MSVCEAKEKVLEMAESSRLLPNVVNYSLQSKTVTLKTGQTCDMPDFMYNLIKLTLQNIQLNHQQLVIGMAAEAFEKIRTDLLINVEELR